MSSVSDEPAHPEAPDAAPSRAETRASRRAARESAEDARCWGPASQAAVVGALSLIPARRYPGWLKQGLTWGSTGLVAAVALTPGAVAGLLKVLGAEQQEDAEQQQQAGQEEGAEQLKDTERQQQAEQEESASSGSSAGAREDAERPQVSWMSRSAAALVVGGFAYGTWRFAWWADDAAERALRRMRVPAPRVVMAAGAAALAYREARQDQEARSQVQGQSAQHQTQG